jgi:ELWxxDGT repeat protein
VSGAVRSWFLAVLLGLCVAPAGSAAGPAHLVVDLNPGSVAWDPTATSIFRSFTRLGDRTLFLSFLNNDVQCGLWTTDGTAAGTEFLADICGESLNLDDVNFQVQILGTAGGIAFLLDSSQRLWRTDGTAAGTFSLGVKVSTVNAQPIAGPRGILCFVVCDKNNGNCALWGSDGTAAGTRPLRALESEGGPLSSLQFFVQGDRVWFSVTGPQGGVLLWTTDGTASGTRQLARFSDPVGSVLAVGKALYVSTGGSRSSVWLVPADGSPLVQLGRFGNGSQLPGVSLLQAGGRVLLEAGEGEGVVSLWEILAPYHRVRFLARFSNGMGPVAVAGGQLIFAASAAGSPGSFSLWVLGPKMGHPLPVRDCPAGCPEISPSAAQLGVLGGRVVFAGQDSLGSELWESDGTGAGTRLLKDLCPGECGSLPRAFSPALGRLVFTAGDHDLWVTDGTTAGTSRLGRIVSAVANGLDAAVLNSRLIFDGVDDVHGSQPWASDLTVAGTALVVALDDGLAAGSFISLAPFGSGALFSACSAAGSSGLWHSDGTAAGTDRLLDAGLDCTAFTTGPFSIGPIVTAGGAAFFTRENFANLWRTDGTPEGTRSLASWSGRALYDYLPFNGGLLAVLSPADPQAPSNWSFWRSDGTPQGTVQTGLVPSRGGLFFLETVGSGVLFEAQRTEPPFPEALWRTDGTTAGTVALLDLSSPPQFADFVPLKGKACLVVEAAGRPVGRELWTTDGTAAGTVPVIAAVDGPRPLNPRSLAVFQGDLYFFADTGDAARSVSLWRSDGTAAGTVPVFDLPGDPTLFSYPTLVAAGGFVFFRLDDGVHGEELWQSDGTAAGTVMVRDIAPGPAHSRADSLTAAGGRLYFTATDGEHGLELWTSDGTAAGTAMVQDIFPGPVSSWPQDLVAADGKLFFTADDGVHGRELWVLPLEP